MQSKMAIFPFTAPAMRCRNVQPHIRADERCSRSGSPTRPAALVEVRLQKLNDSTADAFSNQARRFHSCRNGSDAADPIASGALPSPDRNAPPITGIRRKPKTRKPETSLHRATSNTRDGTCRALPGGISAIFDFLDRCCGHAHCCVSTRGNPAPENRVACPA